MNQESVILLVTCGPDQLAASTKDRFVEVWLSQRDVHLPAVIRETKVMNGKYFALRRLIRHCFPPRGHKRTGR